MRTLFATTIAAFIATVSLSASAQTPTSGAAPKLDCAIGYVTGVGGAAQSMREYLASPDRDRYRYVADNPIQCKVSDEGRASGCTGVANFRNEKVSVYDEIDSTTMAVVARVELDHGDYPAIIVVQKKDVKCETE